jgi:hypothetical protein
MYNEWMLITIIGILFSLVKTSEDEHRLIHYLFSEQGYNPLVRPTEHSNETVIVSFGLLLVQLIHVKKKCMISFNVLRIIYRCMKKNKL